eukprot:CAMPEP_0168283174 /NCGR_PEP_ID=MMETSP0141_2-20121125/22793_1 /TAXON_ID=44445 /ORGANISM="Pseudo-nitzschia australis, Strain 10249 10 AB" /LENGTH=56 /DNA_ID=CAMNT_0008227015 /DNA_START=310 /DNA_END=480 /DNA_ORIENTATION=+
MAYTLMADTNKRVTEPRSQPDLEKALGIPSKPAPTKDMIMLTITCGVAADPGGPAP